MKGLGRLRCRVFMGQDPYAITTAFREGVDKDPIKIKASCMDK